MNAWSHHDEAITVPGCGRKGAIRGAGVQGRERVRQESRVGACWPEGVPDGDKIRRGHVL